MWSPTDHSEFVGITGAAATRSSPAGSAYQSARTNLSLSGSITYIEFTITNVGSGENTGPGMMVGIANGAASLSNYAGGDNNGCSYRSSGSILKNALGVTGPGTFTTSDVIGMAVDMPNQTVKFRKNGGAWSVTTDISSLGQEVFASCSMGNGSTPPNVTAALATTYPLAPINLVAHGDSMSLTGNVQQTYLPRVIRMLKTAGYGVSGWTRCGINGASWAYAWPNAGYASDMTADALLRVDTVKSASLTNWLIVFAGTNGILLGSHSAATEYANFKTYIAARISAGWTGSRIVVCTMLPRTTLSESTRSTYNASLVGDDAGTGYKVVRLDLDPNLGLAGQNLNLSWFLDGTHPTDAGHAIIAQLIFNAITS